jgi:hypothetical protein
VTVRESSGVPSGDVKASPDSCHSGPTAIRSSSCLCLVNTASGKIRLTSAPSLAILRAMRHLVGAVAAVEFAVSTRRDLVLKILALRHQLRVVRSNRRFRPPDLLVWLVLRRSWPRWREALVLVQPATVGRWHRDGLHRCSAARDVLADNASIQSVEP